jgi:hypothetical protein
MYKNQAGTWELRKAALTFSYVGIWRGLYTAQQAVLHADPVQ